jgi:hypothetical protein
MAAKPCKPIPMDPELVDLLEKAKNHVMTPEERAAQQRSWVIGNVMLGNPDMKREDAERIYDRISEGGQLLSPRPGTATDPRAEAFRLDRAPRDYAEPFEGDDEWIGPAGPMFSLCEKVLLASLVLLGIMGLWMGWH